jgi:invasion protein IalB
MTVANTAKRVISVTAKRVISVVGALVAVLAIIPATKGDAAPFTPDAPVQPAPINQSPSTRDLPAAAPSALVFSPWTKVCNKAPDAGAKQLCFTVASGRRDAGTPNIIVTLIEPGGENGRFLRITLPLGMQLPAGTRLTIDQSPSITAPFILCLFNGCMADYQANNDLMERLKNGQQLIVQAVERQGQTVSFVVPLADFAKAYAGPATDVKSFEEREKALQETLRKRASTKPEPAN